MDIKLIGDRIKQARTLRNYTLDDIANEIGVTKSTIQRYENGLISKPKLPVLQSIADSLKVNPAWISGQDIPMEIDDSLVSILNRRIEETGMTLEEVAEKAGVSLRWLQRIDTFMPGEYGFDDEIGYEWITRVAEVLGLPGSTLRAALALQEAPFYTGPVLSAEEALRQAQEDFKEPITEDNNRKSFISKAEHEHIKRYRSLDEKGKHTVDTILQMEYNRCSSAGILNAAHADENATEEEKQHDEDIMNDDEFWK
jgi:transcriptional regulator with XRE-family HTH domain